MKSWHFVLPDFQSADKLTEWIIQKTKLSNEILVDLALKGGLWRKDKKTLKVRTLKELSAKDKVFVYYHPDVLKIPSPNIKDCLIYNDQNFSVWDKPAGMLSQGNNFSDHLSLLRLVELHFKSEMYLVHRLDRETMGLMVIAHNSKSAAFLSQLFQKRLVEKKYQALVKGNILNKYSKNFEIRLPLEDKEALTKIQVILSSDKESMLEVELVTGRLHQIRRHLNMVGYPIIGDPKYGKNNKNTEGLRLLCFYLSFSGLKFYSNQKLI